ncbi:MAG: hypothetical protein WBK77_06360 [Alphaproteobacteria bacterium]|jgi:hypothetical protein
MKQITILSENKTDLIADITQFLAEKRINIESVTGRNFGKNSVVTITVQDYQSALNKLQECERFQVICEDAIIVKVTDELGALAKLTRRFSDAGVQINSIRFVERHEGYALVAISTERTDQALNLVNDILVY